MIINLIAKEIETKYTMAYGKNNMRVKFYQDIGGKEAGCCFLYFTEEDGQNIKIGNRYKLTEEGESDAGTE